MAFLFIGIVMLLTDIYGGLIVYAIGAVPIVSIRIFNRVVCNPDRRRTNTILVVSSLFLIAAGVAKLLNESNWIVFILITATLDFYISFRKIK
jgi:hypothetical protein